MKVVFIAMVREYDSLYSCDYVYCVSENRDTVKSVMDEEGYVEFDIEDNIEDLEDGDRFYYIQRINLI